MNRNPGQRSSDAFDVAIVGSGIVGLGAAYAALRRGLRVVVIERGARIAGASVRNFGHLCIGAQEGEASAYADAGRALWLQLAREADFWMRESGTLIVARHADELRLLEAAAVDGGIRLLDAREIEAASPLAPGIAVGGARVEVDLQTNPRVAAERIARHLESQGVEFRMRTSATAVSSGRVETSRGGVDAPAIIVAVGHDLDHLLPDLAHEAGVERCALDMMRVQAALARPLDAPLLTGWSLVRYGRFARLAEAAPVRERLHAERPDLAAIDLNQMYTQLPDGSLLLGDTHVRDSVASPFQSEDAQQAILDEAQVIFGISAPRVIERWQGVYASAAREFLSREIAPGAHAIAVTTGIGMTCGLGFAEQAVAAATGLPLPAVTHEQDLR
ncbi:TIGR03364 family FAD-dependent oxidoreductase [Leucobacter sp. L43]|uniref:TIGR03364 family FAD-dependent oxidoreductase n=1 Tax=Leucobacter sp. L43 TaxID=2798040 RepID=UPI001907B2F7|nr:TIGR03364 family FAD-dependent oxidoreductase [Leucobacter sp. L43]